ncbi:MAG: hypothetical protein J5725_10460, partial [Bacteroidales bacterium]|nr:hypothetical protein [Bacteroidales bacterium]
TDETYYLSTYDSTNLVVTNYDDGAFPATQGSYESYRPVFLANIMASSAVVNSASITEIVNPQDTVVALPNVPVKVVLHNNGGSNLSSATIGWSLNGVVQTPYQFATDAAHPVYWDFDTVVTIGTFTPQINRYDTIVAWVTMPNGVLDSNTFDDTLTKVVFGATDLQYEWVKIPDDTVYGTGPYQMQLRVWSMSGNSTVSNLNLKYRYKDTTGTWLDSATLSMVNIGNNIWQVTIPNIRIKNHVEYLVTMTDYLNNVVTASGYYYIKGAGVGGYMYIGDTVNTTTTSYAPYYSFYDYSWSQMLYTSSDFPSTDLLINDIAFKISSSSNVSGLISQEVYMKVVTDASIINTTYVNPLTDGATLVWTGSIPGSIVSDTWVNIQLTTPFLVPGGKGVLIYWLNNDGSYDGTCQWYANTSNSTLSIYQYQDGSMPTGSGSSTSRPIMRINAITVVTDSNSVAVEEFVSPIEGATTVGVHPVKVVIRNHGLLDLTSCIVGYSVDGVLQDTIHWTGLLPADFIDTIDFGTINILPNTIYELTAWVSSPNGVYDSISYDDTLTISTIACTGAMTGVVRVDPSGNGDATSLSSALYAVKNCGMSGKLTIEMANGTYAESINLTDLSSIMKSTDTLEITSASGIADSVKFVGSVTLGDNNNIYLTHITIDASAGTYGVQLTKPCDNIEISNCIIKANINSTSSSAIYYVGTTSSSPMGRLKILDNTIIGGYYGIQLRYLYPNASTMVTGTGYATIKGNHLSEVGYYGLYLYYYGKYDY